MNYSKMLNSVSKYLIYLEKKLDEANLSTAISTSVPAKNITNLFNPISVFIFLLIVPTVMYGCTSENNILFELSIVFLSSFYYICFILMVVLNSTIFYSKNKINRYLAKDLTFILLENIRKESFTINKFEDAVKVWFLDNEIHKRKNQENYLKFTLINLEERGDIVFDRCLWFKSLRSYYRLKNFRIIQK
jgi:hypothetical protein